MIDLCIIGCGAAGMAAAVAYGMTAPDGEVCILEKKKSRAGSFWQLEMDDVICPT